jgi:hypothetical protein
VAVEEEEEEEEAADSGFIMVSFYSVDYGLLIDTVSENQRPE